MSGRRSDVEQLRHAIRGVLGVDPPELTIAIGWATVDLQRAAREFHDRFGGACRLGAPAPDDTALGARCLPLRVVDGDMPPIVLLEPITEGRLAAALARHGEGAVATWLREGAGSTGRATTDGPFGREILLDHPRAGPFRLLVPSDPGTIVA
jgi:hypothetical protein